MKLKDFWQRYRHAIAKLLTTHIAMSVFAILCTSPFMLKLELAQAAQNLLIGIVAAFTFCFYYYLVRVQLWDTGAKDKLASDGGRLTLCPLAGLYMGIIASIPSLLLNSVYLVSYFYQDYAGFQTLHHFLSLAELLWDAPALGIRLLSGSPFSYLASSVAPALFAGLTYYLGTKEFSLFPKKRS